MSRAALLALALAGCTVGGEVPPCGDSTARCEGDVAIACDPSTGHDASIDCAAQGLACVPLQGCLQCAPGRTRCDGRRALACAADGSGEHEVAVCDPGAGEVCSAGACVSACALAAEAHGYEGCELLAVDLDNYADAIANAAAQQYALALSNPGEHAARVVIEADDGPAGGPASPRVVAEVVVEPDDVELVPLPAREVDGTQADGTVAHSALGRRAYRVRSSLPIIGYQLNPFANVGAFSDDASLLLPTHALGDRTTVIGWPQTLGDDEPARPQQGRAFLTVAAAAPTHVTVALPPGVDVARGTLDVLGEVAEGLVVEADLGPLDVLNLETTRRGADLTGVVVTSDAPVAVFTGSECADVPAVEHASERLCCCDHLEEQLLPDHALGQRFAVPWLPSRSRAIGRAYVGDPATAGLTMVDEPQWIRVLATEAGTTTVTTSAPAPDDRFTLERGRAHTFATRAHVTIEADAPVSVMIAAASQEAAGVPIEWPGGDPSIVIVPPVEQYRDRIAFLTPLHYAFDFVSLVAAPEVGMLLDGAPLPPERCERAELAPDLVVHTCQLSEPDVLGPGDDQVRPGIQRDGVHRLIATGPVLVLASGFDRHVGYAYPAGLDVHRLE